jgi:hypothetical protein
MGMKERKKMQIKHGVKRRKKRLKLLKKGLDPNEFYSGKFYIGNKSEKPAA